MTDAERTTWPATGGPIEVKYTVLYNPSPTIGEETTTWLMWPDGTLESSTCIAEEPDDEDVPPVGPWLSLTPGQITAASDVAGSWKVSLTTDPPAVQGEPKP